MADWNSMPLNSMPAAQFHHHVIIITFTSCHGYCMMERMRIWYLQTPISCRDTLQPPMNCPPSRCTLGEVQMYSRQYCLSIRPQMMISRILLAWMLLYRERRLVSLSNRAIMPLKQTSSWLKSRDRLLGLLSHDISEIWTRGSTWRM